MNKVLKLYASAVILIVATSGFFSIHNVASSTSIQKIVNLEDKLILNTDPYSESGCTT